MSAADCLFLLQATSQPSSGSATGATPSRKTQASGPKVRKSVSSRIHEAVKAIALCHNVTPVYESHAGVNGETESAEADQDFSDDNRTYQASSPDEVDIKRSGYPGRQRLDYSSISTSYLANLSNLGGSQFSSHVKNNIL